MQTGLRTAALRRRLGEEVASNDREVPEASNLLRRRRVVSGRLKEVPPELLTIADIAVRVREPGLVPVEGWLRQGERRGFERSSPRRIVNSILTFSSDSLSEN